MVDEARLISELKAIVGDIYVVHEPEDLLPAARQLAQEMDLDLYADFVVTSGDVGQGKPHSPIYLAALSHASAEASQAIHVGDSISADVEGAMVAGIRPVYMNRYPDVPQEETLPEGVPIVHTLADVEALLGL